MLHEWIARLPGLQYWGYALAFLAAFIETLPGLGLFVPGQTVVLIAGFLSQQGVLTFWPVFILAVLGAVIGDAVGFVLGRKYGLGLFRRQRGFIKEVMRLVHEHPIKTLVLGRFNSLTRAFAPFAAGASSVPRRTFVLANVIGGTLWALTWTVIGYLFGASYDLVSTRIDTIMLSLVLVFSVALIAYHYLKRQRLVTQRVVQLLTLNLCSLLLFGLLVWQVRTGGFFLTIDLAVNHANIQLFAVTVLAYALSLLFTATGTTLLTAAGAWLLVHAHNRRHAALLVVVVLSAAVLDAVLKEVILRPRPEGGLLVVESFSFPSGHTFLATVYFGALITLYTRYVPWRRAFVSVCAGLVVLVAASRLYLGVHWLSDVLGGLAAGLFWLTFLLLLDEAYRAYHNKRRERLYRT